MNRPPFASLLLELRQAGGLTQEELATRARVGVRTVRELEAGRATRPQRSTVDLLATALGLTGSARARFEALARGRPAPSGSVPRIEPLIGRDADAAGVTALLEIADLVTIIGLSGVGKAALAITVAGTIAGRYARAGAVRVTEASTEAEILASTAAGLGVSHVDELAASRPDTGGRGLSRRPESALLVVANADHRLVAARAAITWLRQHTGIRIIATSRQPLGLPGEHQWVLCPLEVPPPDATGPAVFEYPATRLFLDRLRRVRSEPVAEADAPVLGALVRRLGGLPFALQLAAARGRVLGLSDLLDRASGDARGAAQRGTAGDARGAAQGGTALDALGARLDGTEGAPVSDGAVGADPVGETVRSAVLASWELLTPVERTCLCWLSVFQWRWSMDLAEELLSACPPAHGQDVVAVVDRLVGLGLIRARTAGTALPLHVFDPVRWVALEHAQAQGFLTAARDQHATVMARVCVRAWGETGERMGDAARAALTGDARKGAVSSTVIAYLLADMQAAADHLGATGDPVPRQQSRDGRHTDAAEILRRGLVQWLGA